MNLIKTILGRRQFLIAAGVTSASAFASKNLAGVSDSIFQMSAANAGEKALTSTAKGTSHRYGHLLSPLKFGNVILKNRMIYTQSTPHYLQGPEIFPSDVMRSYYAGIAKSGAAVVICPSILAGGGGVVGGLPRKERTGDSAHGAMYDIEDPAVLNYMDQLVEGVHCYGSLAATNLSADTVANVVAKAKLLQAHGFDLAYMGGDGFQDKARASFLIEQIKAVKNATGFVIGMYINVIDPLLRPEWSDNHVRSQYTLEEAIEAAKMFEGIVDILQFRLSSAMTSHPIGFNQEENNPLPLRVAQAIKESGAKIIVAPNGGFRDPDKNEEYIATGKCDMIAMARPFIADWDYGQKIYEGRGEDIVPCIMCNKCHGLSMQGQWYSVCSVNPALGISTALRVISAPNKARKVAVIGGGPAGMKAAIVASERGHKVTLFEKNEFLGGLLRHADFSPFKWPIREYKDFLIRQVKNAGIDVLLKTEATPDMIKKKGFDVVLAAVGSEPNVSRIPGAEGKNVFDIVEVYGKEKELGKNVTFIGGGEFGVETGMYLAKSGHKVTMLTSEKELLPINRVHYPEIVIDTYENLDNFNFITEAIATRISTGKVTYMNSNGSENSIQTDSVVIYGGLNPRQDEALKFADTANNAFYVIGDCSGNGGNVQKVIRNAFFTASQL